MSEKLPKLVFTSVVRGSQQGESHGGIFVVDFESRSGDQVVDWNTSDIDFDGRGADRGLRGITFDGDDIYIAASDELFCYGRDWEISNSYKNRYLKHSHEIVRKGRHIFVTSTGFDSILRFDLETKKFDWGFRLTREYDKWSGYSFDPQTNSGPAPVNDFHVNMVHVDEGGIFLSGLRTNALLRLNPDWSVSEFCSLPAGTHNAQPWRGGVLFNDTAADAVRFVARDGRQAAFGTAIYPEDKIQNMGIDDSKVARQGFGRGLCVVSNEMIAAGSSPTTITLFNVESGQTVSSVNLSMDIRNAVHGLEVWPFDDSPS